VGKDEKKAVEWFQKAAEKGVAEAMFSLAWMYENGRGVAKDEKDAAKWYEKAAALGHGRASQELARLAPTVTPAPSPAAPDFILLLLQCVGGALVLFVPAYLILTACFRAGWPLSGTFCLARLGGASRQEELGDCYAEGKGGANQNPARAARWYRKAADNGRPKAAFALGLTYEHGRGVDKDASEALAWYKKAALLGHDGAKEKVEELESGISPP